MTDLVIPSSADVGNSARVTAGLWRLASDPGADSALVNGVKVGVWQMPWNARPDAGRLAPGIPPSNFWASDPNGINQVGCVYTAQGFEFDYVGVLFGRTCAGIRPPRTGSAPPAPATTRSSSVPTASSLPRGPEGCYVHFEDEDMRLIFLARQK